MEPTKRQIHQQAFKRGADTWFRGLLVLIIMTMLGLVTAAFVFERNQGYGVVGVTHEQPILFSHRHHSGDLGIDCRYCHTSVEKSAFAGMPSTATCLSCHRGLFRSSSMLAPLWESLESGEPIAWNRVHDVMDIAFFNHQVHVTAGISCRDCHGNVEQMVTVRQVRPMTMQWCLNCHRSPGRTVSPAASPINVRRALDPRPPPPGTENPHAEPFNTANLTDCSACHR